MHVRVSGEPGQAGDFELTVAFIPPPPVCGPGAGDCCSADFTPGCASLACCALVCYLDPFCCDTTWDRICADEAVYNCSICGGH